jgi:hypothetical protein
LRHSWPALSFVQVVAVVPLTAIIAKRKTGLPRLCAFKLASPAVLLVTYYPVWIALSLRLLVVPSRSRVHTRT